MRHPAPRATNDCRNVAPRGVHVPVQQPPQPVHTAEDGQQFAVQPGAVQHTDRHALGM
jgi:hypothetical protein